MSYLARLARPAAEAHAPAPLPPMPAPAVFGDIHEEVVMPHPPAASPATGETAQHRVEDVAPHTQAPPEPPVPAGDRAARPIGPRAALEPAMSPRSVPASLAPRADAEPVVAAPREVRSMPTPQPEAPRPALPPGHDAQRPARIEPAPVATLAQTVVAVAPEGPAVAPRPAGDPLQERSTRRDEPVPTRRTAMVAVPSRSDASTTQPAARAPAAHAAPSIHIGAISLTVKAPAAAPAAASLAAPVAAPPAAPTARPRDGLGFSASRHYLRRS